MKTWSVDKIANNSYRWILNDNIDTHPSELLRLSFSDIKWIITYLYNDDKNHDIEIVKTSYYSSGTISIPIDNETEISILGHGIHEFSMYDLDGNYAFSGGYYEYEPEEEKLLDLYGEDILEKLDDIGSESSIVLVSGRIELSQNPYLSGIPPLID